ncbi:NACHT domain-containing protein [Streptomyces sp. NPDC014894]|uniref:NACHT domain-containing protein n=1 Tax=Streptomyces sp. NPDC014894 TaxID=3364931 RepID=UPI0036F6A5B7
MRARRLVSYSDAVAILTGDSAGLAAADRLLGGALTVATGGVSDVLLNALDAQGRILRLGRDLTAGLRENLRGTDRAARTERIAAAHTVLVVTAFFDALGEEGSLPFRLEELELTRDEQIAIAGGAGRDLLEALLTTGAPQPAPHTPYENLLDELRHWYWARSDDLTDFLHGLAVWDGLTERQRDAVDHLFSDGVFAWTAVECYQELYSRLALEVPEFGLWSGRMEHRATRVAVRQALGGIESALAGLSVPSPLRQVAESLATGYRAALPRPMLAEGQAPAGVCLPTLGEGYVDPDFRARPVLDGAQGPAEEGWWEAAPVRSDLTEYLAGTLTTVAAATAPLIVLGQPGAGKSVLTKILAARLTGAGYLPVRIVLREVPADADIQDQIEHAVRTETGERATWPELVRAAGGAVPVLLFDGFDELLQATGVSQSDFLVRVARFQEREADQGRPVFALVTSRTAVADRARYPDGSVALRLEPFNRPQIARWLELWGRLNERSLTERGLRPLTADVAQRHQALASQPLLLLMLALYDGTDNSLQRGAGGDEPLGEAELYEELLASFAVREVSKSAVACTEEELRERAEQELQRLSLISFGMLNRRRQWITAAEAESDLAAVLGRPEPVQDGFRAPLGQGEIALGRFFFVQRAQAVRDDQRLATYEFLHATFGEYLAARLAVQLLEGLLGQRPALSLGRAGVDDDLLYVLLSYAPLSSRQMLRFVGARIDGIGARDRHRLGELLLTVMADHHDRTEHRYTGYRPVARPTAARHGVYSANLFILTLLVTGGVRASRLFPDVQTCAAMWHRRAQLWRAAFTEPEWTDFARALSVRRVWDGDHRDLDVRPAQDLPDPPEPVDVYWLHGRAPAHEDRGRAVTWVRPYADQIRHKMMVAGGTNDAIVLHAIDPVFTWLAPAVTTFVGTPDGTATSVAHGLTSLWLAGGLGAPEDELAAQYELCASFIGPGSGLDDTSQRCVARLLLGQLATDAIRLPAAVVGRVLAAVGSGAHDTVGVGLMAQVALMALDVHGDDAGVREGAEAALAHASTTCPDRLLALWAQRQGSGEARSLLGEAVADLLAHGTRQQLAGVEPAVLDRARRFAADREERRPGPLCPPPRAEERPARHERRPGPG